MFHVDVLVVLGLNLRTRHPPRPPFHSPPSLPTYASLILTVSNPRAKTLRATNRIAMVPHPSLFPPAAFERGGGLPPREPSRFSSNPTFDMAFLKAAFDGDLGFVKSTYLPPSAIIFLHFPGSRMVPCRFWAPIRPAFQGGEGGGQGAEGRRLAEMLGAVRDGYGNGLLHSAILAASPCAATWSRTSGWMSTRSVLYLQPLALPCLIKIACTLSLRKKNTASAHAKKNCFRSTWFYPSL
jgi:hypothetical protein